MPIYYFDLHNNEVEYIEIRTLTIENRVGEPKHRAGVAPKVEQRNTCAGD